MDFWSVSIYIYVSLSLITLMPTIMAIFEKIKLNPGGKSFEESTYFSNASKQRLISHYSRIQGTLIFWKNKAEQYKYFHYYCLIWTIPISILIPTLLQFVDGNSLAKIFLTIMSTHSAVIVAIHKALKVENHYKSFRQGESEFYDTYRQLLDTPFKFGDTEEEQVNNYILIVEKLRKSIRNLEIDNFPHVNEIETTQTKN